MLVDPDEKRILFSSGYVCRDVRRPQCYIRRFLTDEPLFVFYFVVIDDIWERKSWDTIKLALVQDICGISRVITTTRNVEVARECGEVYKLEPLPFDKSKKLFYKRIFGSEGNCFDTQLDEASDKMLKKCDGVPLAMITVASLLVGKSWEEWIEVCHSTVFRDKKNQQVTDTEWILSLSYHDLPAHLKTCLLFLSAFPEDFVIDKNRLIWRWVAKGFVHNKEPGTSLFEVGEEYLNELIFPEDHATIWCLLVVVFTIWCLISYVSDRRKRTLLLSQVVIPVFLKAHPRQACNTQIFQ
jgi:hypothetical protein